MNEQERHFYEMEMKPLLISFQNNLVKKIQKHQELLKQQLYDSLDKLMEKIQGASVLQDYKIAYLQFSLLQISFIQETYEICVAAYDKSWYRERGIFDSFSVSYLFEELTALKMQCMSNTQKYVGKIRACVIEQCIVDEIVVYNQFFLYYFIQWFMQIEEVKYFHQLPKEEEVMITWGNYKADAQIIHYYDIGEKNPEQFHLLLNKKDEAKLMYTNWKGLHFNNMEITYKNMTGISFKKTILNNLKFEQSYLVGTNFKESELRDCAFYHCDLKISDFTGCTLINITFNACDLRECIWTGTEFNGVQVIYGEYTRVIDNENDLLFDREVESW